MTVVRDYLEVAQVIRTLLASDEVAKYWEYPSALEEWTVAGLAGHLARPVLQLPSVLAESVSQESVPVTAVEYFSQMPASSNALDSPAATAIRQRGVQTAGTGVDDLLARFDDVFQGLDAQLPELPLGHEISTPAQAGGVRMLLSQYLITRLVEMVVHADDLAVSVGVVAPDFPVSASDTVLSTLACIASRRNSPIDVMRVLARAERPIQRVTAF